MFARVALIALVLTCQVHGAVAAGNCEYNVDTFLGGGIPENVPALESNLDPASVATWGPDLYIAARDRVRLVSADGNIRTIAGVGPIPGSLEDGAMATDADLRGIRDIVVLPDKTIYVVAFYSVRRIDPDGRIYTVAGIPMVRGVPGDGEGQLATTVAFFDVRSVDVGPDGALYIATYRQVRRVGADGILTTVAGTSEGIPTGEDGIAATEAGLANPLDVAVDASGGVYIADTSDSRVRYVDPQGILHTVVGERGRSTDSGDGGPAVGATIDSPASVYLDTDGSLLIGGWRSARVRRIGPSGTINTVVGTGVPGFSGDGGPSMTAQLGESFLLRVCRGANGSLYVSDGGNGRIRAVSPAWLIDTVAGNGTVAFGGDGGPVENAAFASVAPTVVLNDGSVLVGDVTRIRRISPDGIVDTWAGTGEGVVNGDDGPAIDAGILPTDLATNHVGEVFVLESGHAVRKIGLDGIIRRIAGDGVSGFVGDGGPAIGARFDGARAIALGPDGSIYVADEGNGRVRRIDPGGIIVTFAGTGDFYSSGDGGPAVEAGLSLPSDLAVDGVGNLYVSERGGHRIRKIDRDGIISTVVGTGEAGFSGDHGIATQAQIASPGGIAFTAKGELVFADRLNYRVRAVDPTGTIRTIAGTGEITGPGYYIEFNGDGQCATDANLASPEDINILGDRILVSDYWMGRIRTLIPTDDVPVAFSGLEAHRTGEGVVLAWQNQTGASVRYTIERAAGGPYRVVRELDPSSERHMELLDRLAQPALELEYLVRARLDGGAEFVLGPVTVDDGVVPSLGLGVHPNPSRGSVRLQFASPRSTELSLEVFDLRGRRLRQLLSGRVVAGSSVLEWDGLDERGAAVASGTYLVVLRQGGERSVARKVVIVR